MAYAILKGLALGAILALAPLAAFLLWISPVWWVLPVIGGALILMLLVAVGEVLGWRWARAIAPFVLNRRSA